MTQKTKSFEWLDLGSEAEYRRWRDIRLKTAEAARDLAPVAISSLTDLSAQARDELVRRCEMTNFAVYSCAEASTDVARTAADLRRFAAHFGLRIAETHRSAGDQGIVALQPSQEESKRGYIPYSRRPMNWHTDGYYNAPSERISAFVLHCVRQAAEGGENQILDPEILYIRLRDADPELLRALMHPQAMTIPENREPDGTLRPASVGPVFYPDPDTGRLQMRYTARTRSIAWRDDPTTQAAERFIREHLAAGDPLAVSIRLEPGQGILNNNVLHNRTGFAGQPDQDRLIFRVRFHNRVQRRETWPN